MKLLRWIKNNVGWFYTSKTYQQYLADTIKLRNWQGGAGADYDIEAIKKIPDYVHWAYVCMDKIAKNIAGLPLKFYKGYAQPKEIDKHPIIDLIYRPNHWKTHRNLFYETIFNKEMLGDAYWILEGVNENGTLNRAKMKIYVAPSDKMEAIPNDKDFIEGFVMKTGSRKITYKPHEIVWFNNYNYRNLYKGSSRLKIGENVFASDFYARRYNSIYFENNASPGTVLETDSKFDKDLHERIVAEWNQRHRGIRNAHKVTLLWQGLKLASSGKSPKDLDFINLIKLTREEIIALFGVPPAEVGIFEYANYANAMVQKKMFWESSIMPIMMDIETTLNEITFPEWAPGEEIWFEFDTSNVDALREDEDKKASTVVRLVRGSILTPNEAREKYYNLEPITGGDELILPQKPPMTGVASLPSKVSIKKFSEQDEKWQAKYAHRFRYEMMFLPHMKRFFKAQKDRVLKRLAELNEYLPADDEVELLFDEGKETDILYKMANPIITSAYAEAGKRAYEEVQSLKSLRFKQGEISGEFNLSDPAVTDWIETHGLFFCKTVNATTKKMIAKMLAKAYEEGTPVKEFAKMVAESFDNISKGRAYSISQTEMGNAINTGTFEGYRQAGADKKRWLATPDLKTRDSHYEVGNHPPIPINERFPVGGDLMLHPNDPAGSPENVINCRCALEPIISEVE